MIKVGDKVISTITEQDLTKGKQYEVVEIEDDSVIIIDDIGDQHGLLFNEYTPVEFQHGETVEVRDYDTQEWTKQTFVSINPKDVDYKYITVDDFGRANIWLQCRRPQQKKEYTIQDIIDLIDENKEELANVFGVPVDYLNKRRVKE